MVELFLMNEKSVSGEKKGEEGMVSRISLK